METINWKERAEQIAELYENGTDTGYPFYLEDVIGAMLQLAKEVHDKACEDQKEICLHQTLLSADYTLGASGIDEKTKQSILNSPNAKFE